MGDSAFAAFDTWVAQPVGSFRVEAFVRLGNDMNRTNDTTGNVFTVRSAGHDVGVARIVAPVGTVDSGEQIVPAAVVGNYGGLAETFPVRMRIGTFYQRETTVTLAAGALDTVRFAVWDVRQPGTHVVRCSTMLASDQNPANDWREDSVTVTGLGIEAATLRPARFTLEPARPNPFSDRTEVRFALPVATEARLDVFDASGARVRTLGSGLLPLGRHAVVWDGRDEHGRTVGPGVYHCVLTAAGFRAVQKLVRLR
jgi:hypothetical protein